MAGKRDYYEVLEVSRSASGQEIATAYRKLAIKYHPDKNPGDEEAVQRFKECAEAFEVLNDSDKRARYDRYGHAGVDGPGGGAHFTDINDIFDAFGDIFGEGVFGDIFGRGGRGRGRGRRARRGADVRADVTLDLLEAARGATKTVTYDRHERCGECQGSGAKPGTSPETCRYCNGAGQVIQTTGIFRVQTTCPSCHGAGSVIKERCRACGGEGQVKQRVEREVRIPAGVDSEMRLRLSNEGSQSPDGGQPGDCYCFITVKEHPLFHREGQHLVCQWPITFSQASLGATLEVPTLEGRDELVIPPGTQAGEVFKLRGRGMPDLHRRGKGDLLVQIQLDVPKSLTKRQEELLRELAEEEHKNVSPHRKSFFEKVKEFFVPDEPAEAGE
jgi:molecular chaperone DnaJ